MPVYLYDVSQLHPDDLTGILTLENKMCGIVNNYPVGRTAVPYEEVQLYANNNRTFRVFVKTPDLNIVNLTGAVGVLSVKPDKTSPTTVIVKHTNVAGEGQIGAADEGEMFFYIVPSDTATLDIRQYVFDVRVTLSSGKKYTIIEGVIDLLQPVG
jgi:hypothetical protein